MKIKLGQLRQIIREEIARVQGATISEAINKLDIPYIVKDLKQIGVENVPVDADGNLQLDQYPFADDAQRKAAMGILNRYAVSNDMLQSRSRLGRRYSDTSGT